MTWKNESKRHELAAKQIKTTEYMKSSHLNTFQSKQPTTLNSKLQSKDICKNCGTKFDSADGQCPKCNLCALCGKDFNDCTCYKYDHDWD